MSTFIANTEVIEKKVDIEQALGRMRRPLEATTVNLEVYGLYSLPEGWKQKIAVSSRRENFENNGFISNCLFLIRRTIPASKLTSTSWKYVE